jgi:hypothetical protein
VSAALSRRPPVRDAAGGPFCDGCGEPEAAGDHARCQTRRAQSDPPRFCTGCGRRLAVQVLPVGYTAACVHCGPVS